MIFLSLVILIFPLIISLSIIKVILKTLMRSVPILDAASDDIVASLVQILDGWVSLSDLVDFRVASVSEDCSTRRSMCLVGSWLLSGCPHGRSSCIEATLFENLTLVYRLICLLCDLVAIIKVFSIEDPFRVLS